MRAGAWRKFFSPFVPVGRIKRQINERRGREMAGYGPEMLCRGGKNVI